MRQQLSYVLVTAARNEEELIEKTIRSVISQTVRPAKWIIVNDGSTDRTEEIVSRYAAEHPWLVLLRMPEHEGRSFASKVHCFNAGYEMIGDLSYDILGNLDADITFEPDYYEYLLEKFSADPKLGVAGTPFIEGSERYDYRYTIVENVSGACQLFRRGCFSEIGGYVPVKEGGIDWIAVTTARMKGWTTRTFLEKNCYHHRKIGTGNNGPLAAMFNYGKKNYLLGGHPVWQMARAVFQMKNKPYLIGGLLLISGYVWGFATRQKRPMSRELLRFYRREQVIRLKQIAHRALTPGKRAKAERIGDPIKTGWSMEDAKKTIIESAGKLEKWLEDHHYKGYDPADGLTSYLRPLTFGRLLLDRILEQVIWKSPFNLRPLLGVKPLDSLVGRGYIARAYLIMYGLTKEESYRQRGISCLNWLMENRAPDFSHYSWGKMFDFASRAGWQKKHEPITVWTSLTGMAFLDAYEMLGDTDYLAVADSVCQWILEVPRTVTESGSCINYLASQKGKCSIHNQSMLAAAMLTRTAKYTGNPEFQKVAREAIKYTCTRQLPDGSWYYGEDPTYHWIDNFHTGYNLDALKSYIEITGEREYEPVLELGFSFYKDHFFEKNGRPRYFHNRTFPIDSQCVSQSIDTLANFSDHDGDALDLSVRVAKWAIANMQDRSGYFYFMRYPYIVLKPPMIHWAQATTLKALAHLASKLEH